MPKTKNISRAQWDLATQSTAANTNTTPAATAASNSLTSALATALSPPTRPRLHAATRTNSNSTTSTRHRRSKENSENGGGEKENTGRLGRSTRTHVTPGVSVLSTTFGPGIANIASAAASGKKLTEKPSKPTKTVRKLKKTPLQDVTSQFVASGMGEGANRTGTAFEGLEEEDILAAREGGPGEVIIEAPAVEATPSRPRKETAATSPLPPSSPPSDFRLPASLEFNLPKPVLEKQQVEIPIEEYDGWRSFDSAIPVASPSRPVAVADEEDPFGFAALERKLKVERAAIALDVDVALPLPAEHDEAQDHPEEEDEDIHLLVADTSSPRPEGLLKRRSLKRALEDEMDHEEDEENNALNAHGSSPASNNNVGVASLILSSPVRAAIVAAAPASTPAAAAPAEGSPAPVTPPTPHKDNHHKRRRISGVPEVEVDVFGPCLATSSSSPAKLQAESPSPTKGSVRRPVHGATAGTHLDVDVEDVDVHGDALDAFNATLDAEEIARDVAAVAVAPETEVDGGRTLRPRPSRSTVALAAAADEKTNDHADADAAMKSAKKARSASRGRGRGRGTSKARRASRSKSMSTRRARAEGAGKNKEGDDEDDNEDLVVDEDEKFEQERQARIAYFRGLDDYEVEKEDVYLI